ncbi:minor capsid protein [Microviridae sp.]|nr:minor capsid protein [Microviridae sp.]
MIGDIIGGIGNLAGAFMQNARANENIALQKKFAQNGIQWKVADAKKAGIHPLYALGAQTHSFAPVQSFAGDSLAAAGQSFGRAVDAYRDRGERLDGFTKASQSLLLEKGKLENDLLKTQIASAQATLNQAGTPPPAPAAGGRYLIPGQGSTAGSLVTDQPLTRTKSAPEALHQEPAAIPEVGFQRTKTGYAVTPSNDAKQRMEDDLLSELAWAVRNRLLPMAGAKYQDPPPYKLPPGKEWRWDVLRQEYQVVNVARKRVTPFGYRGW